MADSPPASALDERVQAILSEAEFGAAEVGRTAADEAARAADVAERRAELVIAERLSELVEARRGLEARLSALTRRSEDLNAILGAQDG